MYQLIKRQVSSHHVFDVIFFGKNFQVSSSHYWWISPWIRLESSGEQSALRPNTKNEWTRMKLRVEKCKWKSRESRQLLFIFFSKSHELFLFSLHISFHSVVSSKEDFLRQRRRVLSLFSFTSKSVYFLVLFSSRVFHFFCRVVAKSTVFLMKSLWREVFVFFFLVWLSRQPNSFLWAFKKQRVRRKAKIESAYWIISLCLQLVCLQPRRNSWNDLISNFGNSRIY